MKLETIIGTLWFSLFAFLAGFIIWKMVKAKSILNEISQKKLTEHVRLSVTRSIDNDLSCMSAYVKDNHQKIRVLAERFEASEKCLKFAFSTAIVHCKHAEGECFKELLEVSRQIHCLSKDFCFDKIPLEELISSLNELIMRCERVKNAHGVIRRSSANGT